MEQMRSSMIDTLVSPVTGGGGDIRGATGAFKKEIAKGFAAPFTRGIDGSSNRANNSPREFLERLRNLSEEPMYFVDERGIEHYNTKYIKVFTKQYPKGVIFEGYFTQFNVPESAQDAQTVAYDFNFVIENIKPLTMLQRVAGMFSGPGSVLGI